MTLKVGKKMNKDVLLIGFYNQRALGVRYLANALNLMGIMSYFIL